MGARTNTLVMLALAIAFGVIAVVLANHWLAIQAPSLPNAQPVAANSDTLVVAAHDLSYGDALSPENLREIAWPAAALPDGSFRKISDLTSDGSHLALTPISPNEPILKWKISGANGRASLSALVTQGMRAVAIRVNDLGGVAGFVLPGDRVDVLYTKSAAANDQDGASTDVLLQNVKVLAADQTIDQKTGKPIQAKDVTVEVSTIDGQKLALAQSLGAVSLTLRAAGSNDAAPAKRVVGAELISSPSVYLAAQKELETAVNGRIGQLEALVQKSDSGRADLLAKLAEVEQKLTGQIKNASGDTQSVKDKLAALEELLKSSQDQSADELRKRLAELTAELSRGQKSPDPIKSNTVTVHIAHGIKQENLEVMAEQGP